MTIAWMILLFLLGASVGSFLNVVIYRLPRGESIAFPGSHCPRCGRAIRPYDNIPILSWLLLRGKCRFCKQPISIRYPMIELVTALLVVGLFVAYYLLGVRQHMGTFLETWPIFTAHAILLVALLACTVVDIEMFEVPLEVCWFASLAALVLHGIGPNPEVMPAVSHPMAAATVGALLGLVVAAILQRRGVLIPSFVDAEPRVVEEAEPEPKTSGKGKKGKASGKAKKSEGTQSQAASRDAKTARNDGHQVAMTRACGINPRVEILREVLYLLPAAAIAVIAWALVTRVPAIGEAWGGLWLLADGRVGAHLDGLFASAFGYLIGGLCIWAVRIVGTLGFGKEAMGLGDVHILAAVGAAAGWVIPVVAFFLAPFFGLFWAFWLLARRGQRELPYGPWLALASLVAMLAYDPLREAFGWYLRFAGLQ